MGPKRSTGKQAGNAQEQHPQPVAWPWSSGAAGLSHSLSWDTQPGQAELLGTCRVG